MRIDAFPLNNNSCQRTRGSLRLNCGIETEGVTGESQPVMYQSGLSDVV